MGKESPPRPVNPWVAALMRVFFRLLYHEFSFTYDWVAASVSVGMWNDWIHCALPHLVGTKVLELGHGPGHLQLALHSRGIKTFGLDRSPQMGHRAFNWLQKKGFVPVLVNGYAQLMPFPSNSFDQVVSTFPSEYIFDPKTLAEVQRVLVAGGSFIVVPVAWITGKRIHERFAAWLFSITGQSPNWDEQLESQIVEMPGFSVTIHRRQLPSSLVVIIEAKKLPDEIPSSSDPRL